MLEITRVPLSRARLRRGSWLRANDQTGGGSCPQTQHRTRSAQQAKLFSVNSIGLGGNLVWQTGRDSTLSCGHLTRIRAIVMWILLSPISSST